MNDRERHAQWRISEDVAWVPCDHSVVVLDLSAIGGSPIVLEQTAAYVWEELAETGPVPLSTLVGNVASAYSADPDAVRLDIEELIDRLYRDGLVAR